MVMSRKFTSKPIMPFLWIGAIREFLRISTTVAPGKQVYYHDPFMITFKYVQSFLKILNRRIRSDKRCQNQVACLTYLIILYQILLIKLKEIIKNRFFIFSELRSRQQLNILHLHFKSRSHLRTAYVSIKSEIKLANS